MKSMQPYLSFNGNCEEAMNFYKSCLGGELNLMRFGDSNPNTPEDEKNLIMHSTLLVDEINLMGSDTPGHHKTNFGNNVTLNVNFTDKNEEIEVFNKLAEGGTITMPLQDTFWGAHFGMLVDKFGVSWMMNCEGNKDGKQFV